MRVHHLRKPSASHCRFSDEQLLSAAAAVTEMTLWLAACESDDSQDLKASSSSAAHAQTRALEPLREWLQASVLNKLTVSSLLALHFPNVTVDVTFGVQYSVSFTLLVACSDSTMAVDIPPVRDCL